MTVYVDELRANMTGSASFPFKKYCHLTADTLEELHTMADRIGLDRSWFQNDKQHPHYDLTSSKRAQAIQCGAEFMSGMDQAKRRVTKWRTPTQSS